MPGSFANESPASAYRQRSTGPTHFGAPKHRSSTRRLAICGQFRSCWGMPRSRAPCVTLASMLKTPLSSPNVRRSERPSCGHSSLHHGFPASDIHSYSSHRTAATRCELLYAWDQPKVGGLGGPTCSVSISGRTRNSSKPTISAIKPSTMQKTTTPGQPSCVQATPPAEPNTLEPI
jgi:hypothetical protein